MACWCTRATRSGRPGRGSPTPPTPRRRPAPGWRVGPGPGGGRETMYGVAGPPADQVFIPLTVGGGVRSVADVDRLLRAGADKVSLNTAAVARPELLGEAAHRFGSQCVVLSVDARRAG